MDTYPVLKAHPLPLPRYAEAKGEAKEEAKGSAKGSAEGAAQGSAPSRATVAQLEAYCLALASLRPPNGDVSLEDDASFDCRVQALYSLGRYLPWLSTYAGST